MEREITYEESLDLEDPVYIDVRSPGEFADDHIPGAINVPVFDNKERSEIGKIYKMIGKDDAVIKGLEFAGSKLGNIISGINKYKGKDIVITCARGGMRSGSVAALINSIETSAFKLKQGYKGYRHYINEKLESVKIKPQIFILQGLTGTGKTEILQEIKNSIDLEGFAGHRSSIFGGIGLTQNTQKKFESLLYDKINRLQNEKYVVIEGESKKLGNLHIPPIIYTQMKSSPVILIKAKMKRRIEVITKEYTKNMDTEKIADIVGSLNSRLGSKCIDTLQNHLSEGNLVEFTRTLLEKYYDPLYKHTLDNINFIVEIENNNSKDTAEEVIHYINNYTHRM